MVKRSQPKSKEKTEALRMTHFTFTGRYAGQTFCGITRNEHDKFMHIQGSNTPVMQRLLRGEELLCPSCKGIYLESKDENDDSTDDIVRQFEQLIASEEDQEIKKLLMATLASYLVENN